MKMKIMRNPDDQWEDLRCFFFFIFKLVIIVLLAGVWCLFCPWASLLWFFVV